MKYMTGLVKYFILVENPKAPPFGEVDGVLSGKSPYEQMLNKLAG